MNMGEQWADDYREYDEWAATDLALYRGTDHDRWVAWRSWFSSRLLSGDSLCIGESR